MFYADPPSDVVGSFVLFCFCFSLISSLLFSLFEYHFHSFFYLLHFTLLHFQAVQILVSSTQLSDFPIRVSIYAMETMVWRYCIAFVIIGCIYIYISLYRSCIYFILYVPSSFSLHFSSFHFNQMV